MSDSGKRNVSYSLSKWLTGTDKIGPFIMKTCGNLRSKIVDTYFITCNQRLLRFIIEVLLPSMKNMHSRAYIDL